MATNTALQTLIELAEKQTDEAAKALGKALRQQQECEQQLVLLEQYRNDYALRFQQSAAQGLSPSQYRNFVGFLNKLDEAILGQQNVVKDSEYRAGLARSEWQQNEKKRLSFNTLQHRADQVQMQKENKREQKQTDEVAARSFFNRRRV